MLARETRSAELNNSGDFGEMNGHVKNPKAEGKHANTHNDKTQTLYTKLSSCRFILVG